MKPIPNQILCKYLAYAYAALQILVDIIRGMQYTESDYPFAWPSYVTQNMQRLLLIKATCSFKIAQVTSWGLKIEDQGK